MFFRTKNISKSAFLALAFLLSGCASDDINLGDMSQNVVFNTKGGSYKIGKPYKVMGKWYYPEEDFDYNETGIASWYGSDFHAKYTANGEVYNMNSLTAAHKTLPLPSIVRVTNLENGRSLVLRVNDRGPFVDNRIIDISKRGAQLLGFQNQGTAKVRVQVLKEESQQLKEALLNKKNINFTVSQASKQSYAQNNASQTTTGGKKYYVQAGAFSSEEMAGKLSRKLNRFGSAQTSPVNLDGWKLYRVRLGPYSTEASARRILDKIHNYGVAEATVIQD